MAFDKTTLEALRAKYGDGHGGSIHDPEFRAVATRSSMQPAPVPPPMPAYRPCSTRR